MPRKNLAKMAAAYKACKELHCIGELDDDLLPVRSLSDEGSESEGENTQAGEGKKTKAGTKKRKRIYETKVISRPFPRYVQERHCLRIYGEAQKCQ